MATVPKPQQQRSADIKSLTIFDVDDTLFTTETEILVRDTKNRVIRKLSPSQFNEDKLSLKLGETYDYSQFASSDLFSKTAKPIDVVLKTAKTLMMQFRGNVNKKIIIVTARRDLDDKKLFLDTFHKNGLDVSDIHIYRAGNIKSLATADAKKTIIRTELKTTRYDIVRMFDDSSINLDRFLDLDKDFPDTDFEAFVIRDSRIDRYKYHRKHRS